MKIIHTADLHIGSKFLKINNENKRNELIASLNNSFKRVIDYANCNNINIILLSGDVFDKDNVIKKDKEYFYNMIKSNPNISFYYLKGNHDISSKYTETIPNLYTFTNNEVISYNIADSITLSGYELNDNNATLYNIIPFTTDRYNILMLHGDTTKKTGNNSINLDKLKDKNINYIALGHIHTYSSAKLGVSTTYTYPGCLIGRGFDETNTKGFVVIDTKANTNTFIPLSNYEFKVLDINISDIYNNYDLLKEINNNISINNKILIQIILSGTLNFELDINLILNDLTNKFYYVDIKNNTKQRINQYTKIDEQSLKGMFIKLIKEDNTLDQDTKEEILKYGLSKINKEIM